MDSGAFYANTQGMDQAMDDLLIAANKLRSILDNLDQEIQPMLNSWDGDAAAMYKHCQQKWNAATDDMRLVLGQAGITVGNATQLYGTVDAQVAAAWQGMH